MVGIKIDEINEELTFDGFCVVSVSLSYPIVSGIPKKAARRINSFYLHNAKAVLRRVKKHIYPASCGEYTGALETSAVFKPCEIKLSVNITYNESGVLSMYRELLYRSGKERSTERYGDTWSVLSGLPMLCEAFLPAVGGGKKKLTNTITENAQKYEQSGSYNFFPGYEKALKKNFSRENFYITDNGPTFFYNEETIAPRGMGVITFTIKTDYLKESVPDIA